ncbi:HyaD/HybD family hydrogenase maturation endopeptidase [Mesorhizobium sp. M1E.F.Ca.ET.045.02.1.1]|uniref:HyaD/HybD family hydrogenase maturation endopeptidase n=1 Tax=Mesorhizobium sp. M1E.F.Ca.ET.045.02.1.1 TaxID=2493672 RepID=UPI000F7507E3|nr:HyaD/HybD family hydrogenase maturation endopeptidase [Mesorhizobium sp. M1E.F.Ca.ET.045.02.1.1]AZO25521.1 HyaD/HybD family hydrogenase maturation endopeptidase [Mesorhizobium sp. M1E.F.Ca.ET.045.02.1.1]
MEDAPSVLVLGIGNLLWADEGFGVRAVEEFNRLYETPDNVRVMDGGTQGIYLVQHIRETDILVVFDAVDYGLPPATIKVVEDDEVPAFLGVKKVSLHQTGFQEVLAMAAMMGDYPRRLLLVGVQPEELDDYGGSLRPAVRDRIVPAIGIAVDWLARQGVMAGRRAEPLAEDETLASREMRIGLYESGRPRSDEACRIGDARILQGGGFRAPENYESEIDRLLRSRGGQG